MSNILQYGDKELAYLSKCDKELGKYISDVGHIERNIFTDVFEGLCFNIINQQLSMKSANTLYSKIQEKLGSISPEKIIDSKKLISYGLPKCKAECIATCAEKFRTGEINAERLSELSDSGVMEILTGIKGIGKWTAEMTLIFCLERPDVLSLSDYGIRKGLSILHKIDITDIKEMQKYKKLYSPYGTTASVYLWEINQHERRN